jgi:hypothetical protein
VTPRLTGAVLNRVDLKSKAYYGYKYSYRDKSQEKDARRHKDDPGHRASGSRPREEASSGPEVGDVSVS